MNKRQAVTAWLVVLVGVLALGRDVYGQDWSQWRGADRNGVVDGAPALVESLPAEGPIKLWEIALPEPAKKKPYYSSPVSAAGKAYLHIAPPTPNQAADVKSPTLDDVILCVEVATGKELWRQAFTAPMSSSMGAPNTPCIVNGKLYFVANNGNVFCLNAATGEKLWMTESGDEKAGTHSSSPIVVAGKVIVNDKKLVALDAQTGARVWEAAVPCMHSSPAVWTSGGKSYVIAGSGNMACVDVADGRIVWQVPGSAKSASSPVVSGNYVAVRVDGAGLIVYAMTETGAEQYFVQPIDPAAGGHNAISPIFHGALIYSADRAKTFCLDVEKKALVWQSVKTGDAKPSPILADGKIIWGGKGKTGLVLMDPADGKVLGSSSVAPAGCTSFGFAEGGRLLVNAGSHLRCYGLKK